MSENASATEKNDGRRRCVEHCSTRNGELKRIINRAHGNSSHLSPSLTNHVSHNADDRCYITNDKRMFGDGLPNTSCASLGDLYMRNIKVEDVKKVDFTLRLNEFIQTVVLSEVTIIWILYFIFAH
jgi:hypothetical protein